MSLKTFHLVFVLVCMVAADMFGAWGVWQYAQYGIVTDLVLGIDAFVASLGIAQGNRILRTKWLGVSSHQRDNRVGDVDTACSGFGPSLR